MYRFGYIAFFDAANAVLVTIAQKYKTIEKDYNIPSADA